MDMDMDMDMGMEMMRELLRALGRQYFASPYSKLLSRRVTLN